MISRGTASFRPLSTLVTDCYKGISGGCLRREYARPMQVLLCDVGPRDGLQNEPEVLPPETRAELVDRLAAAGLRRIEAVSFVRADRVPQMAGAEDVIDRVHRREGVELSGLVLNERGWERFAAAGLDRVNVTFAATETFNLRNGNATLAEAIERADAILGAAGETPATVTISCSFGCPFEGPRRSRRRRRARCAVRGPGGSRPRRHDRGRHAVRGARARRAGRGGRLPRAQHAQHGLRELPRRARGGRARARRIRRRPRRLSLLAARDRQRGDGGSRLPARGGGGRDRRSTSTRSSLSRSWLEEVLGRHARGLRLPRRKLAADGTASGGSRPGTSSGRS